MNLKHDTWEIMQGDVLERLADLPDNSVHCVCTSPPYFGLRDYGVDGQIGLEPTPAAFVDAMVRVFREVRRVLRPDGTCWVNLGDSYAGSGKGPTGINGIGQHEERQGFHSPAVTIPQGMKPKDLMMMPARVAIALQDDGWWLRSDVIWCKRAPMPESVTDRPTTAHEHIFLLTKSARYFYDADAVREAAEYGRRSAFRSTSYENNVSHANGVIKRAPITVGGSDPSTGRNAWSYWLLSPEPTPEAHFATYPTEIPRRAILAGTSAHGCCAECGSPYKRVVEHTPMVIARSERQAAMGEYGRTQSSGTMVSPARAETTGWQPTCTHNAPIVPATVLDPFSGAGTTVKVALRLQRRGIGIELNPEYVAMSERIIRNDAPLFNSVEVVA